MKTFWKIAGIGTILLIILGLGISMVLAQEPDEADPLAETGDWVPPSGQRGGRRGPSGFHGGPMLDTLAEELDMTADEILSELQEGISVAELAENHGVDVEVIIDALTSQARERITERVNTPWTPRESREGMRGGMHGGSMVDTLAETLNMTADEVIAELETGISVAELAAGQGVETQVIVDALLAEREAMLDQAVENGRITQEQADTILEQMAEEIAEHITEPWSPGEHGGHGRGMMPGGRQGGGRMQPGSFGNEPAQGTNL